MKSTILKSLIPMALFVASGAAAEIDSVDRKVRQELVTLPYYGVFDNFTYRVDGSNVTLEGQVTRPTLATAAERAVGRIAGVTEVVNKIEVLPLSSQDDRIRRAVYRAIYFNPALSRYALQAVPPIHIVVRNGDVTLEGVVAASMEKNIATLEANGVAGAFSVVNNLRVEQDG